MAEIKKIKNIQKEKFLQNLEKSYIEGVYSDSFLNRKLGRVGVSYKQNKKEDPDLLKESGELGDKKKEKKIGEKRQRRLDLISKLNPDEKNKCIREVFKSESQHDGALYRTYRPKESYKISKGAWIKIINNEDGSKNIDKVSVNEVFEALEQRGKQKESGALDKWLEMDSLIKEIRDYEDDLFKVKTEKEGWEEALKMEEEGTERHKEIKEKLNNFDININNLEDKIKDKEKDLKEYK